MWDINIAKTKMESTVNQIEAKIKKKDVETCFLREILLF